MASLRERVAVFSSFLKALADGDARRLRCDERGQSLNASYVDQAMSEPSVNEEVMIERGLSTYGDQGEVEILLVFLSKPSRRTFQPPGKIYDFIDNVRSG